MDLSVADASIVFERIRNYPDVKQTLKKKKSKLRIVFFSNYEGPLNIFTLKGVRQQEFLDSVNLDDIDFSAEYQRLDKNDRQEFLNLLNMISKFALTFRLVSLITLLNKGLLFTLFNS